jgi:hypothetical protein
MFCLAACQRSGQNNSEAVRQGVLDRLAKQGLNVSGMDVTIATAKFNEKGDQVDTVVNITAKGQTGGTPMTMPYHLEHQDNKWVVVSGGAGAAGHGTADPNATGTNPHGGAMPADGGAMPGADNPHGGAGKMPSPQDLPPTKKK